MLLLTRKKQESVVIGAPGSPGIHVRVTVLGVSGKQVKLGFEAEGQVAIQRWELWQRLQGADLTESITSEPGAALISDSQPNGFN